MLRQLPPTITADSTPDWLPVGWIVHSTVLKRGRQTKTYTQLRTGKKFFTKDHVLEYIKMEKIREKREYGMRKKANLKVSQYRDTVNERPLFLRDDWKAETRIDMYVNTSKESKFLYENTMESEGLSSEEDEFECNQISYAIEEDEEDFSESEYIADKGLREELKNLSDINSTSLRSQPERIQKLESRAKTQCVFVVEDMSSDSDNKLPVAETSKEENASGEARCVVSNLVESFEEKNLHDAVVECDDETREMPGLTGSFTIEINLVEKDCNQSGAEGTGTRNIEIIDLESDMIHISASSKVVEVTQEPGDKSEELLEAQAVQEETADDTRTTVFFPHREAPSHSNARSAAEDLSNTTQLGLHPQENNISVTKKRKKNTKERSTTNIKKKDIEAPTIQRGKKGSSSVGMERKTGDWPEPCPNFTFEPLTSSSRIEDDSVIRRYFEEHFAAAVNADSNQPLPDFGLTNFSNIKISLNEESESKRNNKSPGPPCVQVASSSLPSCSSIGMQQTAAGN